MCGLRKVHGQRRRKIKTHSSLPANLFVQPSFLLIRQCNPFLLTHLILPSRGFTQVGTIPPRRERNIGVKFQSFFGVFRLEFILVISLKICSIYFIQKNLNCILKVASHVIFISCCTPTSHSTVSTQRAPDVSRQTSRVRRTMDQPNCPAIDAQNVINEALMQEKQQDVIHSLPDIVETLAKKVAKLEQQLKDQQQESRALKESIAELEKNFDVLEGRFYHHEHRGCGPNWIGPSGDPLDF